MKAFRNLFFAAMLTAVVALTVFCTTTNTTDTPSTPPPTSSEPQPVISAPSPDGNPQPVDPAPQLSAVQGQFELIREGAAQVRRLPLMRPVTVTIATVEEFADRVVESFDKDAEENSEIYYFFESVYKLLGVIEPQDSYLDILQNLYSGAAGFYDTELEEIVVANRSSLSKDDLDTLRHEYIHALQDQHFDLDMLLDGVPVGDSTQALLSLVEGDATAFTPSGFAGTLPQWRAISDDSPSIIERDVYEWTSMSGGSVPLVIIVGLFFPYIDGLAFVSEVFLEGGYDLLNSAFDDPPKSTEQVIFPEKYLNEPRDEPLEVSPKSDSYRGWATVDQVTLGQFWIESWLAQLKNLWATLEAVEGWGGDLAELLRSDEDPDQTALIFTIAWDNPLTDSIEFEQALEASLIISLDFSPVVCAGHENVWQGAAGLLVHNIVDNRNEIVVAPDCTAVNGILGDS